MPGAGDCNGLTRRELFAAMAMQGFAALIHDFQSREHMATAAVAWADALIKELDKEAKQ